MNDDPHDDFYGDDLDTYISLFVILASMVFLALFVTFALYNVKVEYQSQKQREKIHVVKMTTTQYNKYQQMLSNPKCVSP